jgi:hypothetical protein
MNSNDNRDDAQETQPDQVTGDAGPEDVKAWEEIAAGRFMPRRIRGSFRGGKLG